MKGHAVHRAVVVVEDMVLLRPERPLQVPDDDLAVGGGRGDDAGVVLAPAHVIARVVQVDAFRAAEVEALLEGLVLDLVDPEDGRAGHHDLGVIPVDVEVQRLGRALLSDAESLGHFLRLCLTFLKET